MRQVDAVVIGAGFGGLYMLYKLRGLGFSVQGFEIGDDVGGTWYWNRYPGARCDVESLDYSYSFDPKLEQEWDWSERYATQPEILRYLRHVADRYDLRPLISFETRVERAEWREAERRWTVTVDGHEPVDAQYLIMATGSLSAGKTPDLEGLSDFAGDVYFTGNWPHDGVDFSGRRVGVIGTGSSGIQAIPLIAEQAAHLTVFQRTPSFTIPAHNRPLTSEEVAERRHGYREHRAAMRQTRAGVRFETTGKGAHEVEEDERREGFERAWAIGGAGFGSMFTDTII
ncbi:MAG: NAD(P)/FAD-dependent oxidoreductase, partial [Sphingomonas sp.]